MKGQHGDGRRGQETVNGKRAQQFGYITWLQDRYHKVIVKVNKVKELDLELDVFVDAPVSLLAWSMSIETAAWPPPPASMNRTGFPCTPKRSALFSFHNLPCYILSCTEAFNPGELRESPRGSCSSCRGRACEACGSRTCQSPLLGTKLPLKRSRMLLCNSC